MDFSSTPVDTLLAYQLALSNALGAIDGYQTHTGVDLSQTVATLTRLSEKIQDALKDEQFEIDKLKEI